MVSRRHFKGHRVVARCNVDQRPECSEFRFDAHSRHYVTRNLDRHVESICRAIRNRHIPVRGLYLQPGPSRKNTIARLRALERVRAPQSGSLPDPIHATMLVAPGILKEPVRCSLPSPINLRSVSNDLDCVGSGFSACALVLPIVVSPHRARSPAPGLAMALFPILCYRISDVQCAVLRQSSFDGLLVVDLKCCDIVSGPGLLEAPAKPCCALFSLRPIPETLPKSHIEQWVPLLSHGRAVGVAGGVVTSLQDLLVHPTHLPCFPCCAIMGPRGRERRAVLVGFALVGQAIIRPNPSKLHQILISQVPVPTTASTSLLAAANQHLPREGW
mmetsp:Transcript_41348/g.87639  ORF Transcript_41348/g.87639 Transcript_41348/m.87639 type:complete len:330 (-) Transcript_41348:1213-2202(-)